jgi:hypothetical protein
MIGFLILIVLMLISYLIVTRLISNNNNNQLVRLLRLLDDQIIDKIDNIKTYGQEKNGWRNNFPTVLGTDCTVFIGKNFILVSPTSSFLFIFRSALPPFLISMEPDLLYPKLLFSRIYKPINLKTSNYGGDLEFTIKAQALVVQVRIHLTFENLGKKNIEKVFEIMVESGE